MNDIQTVDELKDALIKALENEKYALNKLKYKDEELIITKKKLRLYENRWNKLMNLPPVKILSYVKNNLKG
ncbi:hypothetical protein ROU88_01735 [Macrococcus capreoli]